MGPVVIRTKSAVSEQTVATRERVHTSVAALQRTSAAPEQTVATRERVHTAVAALQRTSAAPEQTVATRERVHTAVAALQRTSAAPEQTVATRERVHSAVAALQRTSAQPSRLADRARHAAFPLKTPRGRSLRRLQLPARTSHTTASAIDRTQDTGRSVQPISCRYTIPGTLK
jgi:hypothetical protein